MAQYTPGSQPEECHNSSYVEFHSILQASGDQERGYPILPTAAMPAPRWNPSAWERRAAPFSWAGSLPNAEVQKAGPWAGSGSYCLFNLLVQGHLLFWVPQWPSSILQVFILWLHLELSLWLSPPAEWMHTARKTDWLHTSLPCQCRMAVWYLTSISFLRPLLFALI